MQRIQTETLVASRFFSATPRARIARTADGRLAVPTNRGLLCLDAVSGEARGWVTVPSAEGPQRWWLDPEGAAAFCCDDRRFYRVACATGAVTELALDPPAGFDEGVLDVWAEPGLGDRVVVRVNRRGWRFYKHAEGAWGPALVGTDDPLGAPERGIACSDRGALVAIFTDHTVRVFDGQTGAVCGALALDARILAVSFSGDGAALWVCTPHTLARYDAASLEHRDTRPLPLASALWCAAFSRETGRLYGIVWSAAVALEVDALTVTSNRPLQRHLDVVSSLGDGQVWGQTQDGSLVRLDPPERPIEDTFEGAIERLAATPAGDAVWAQRAGGSVDRVALRDGACARVGRAPLGWSNPDFAPEASVLVFRQGRIDLATGAVAPALDVDAAVFEGAEGPLVSLVAGGVVLAETGARVAIEGFPTRTQGAMWSASVSRNRRWIVVQTGPRAALIDRASGLVAASCKASGLHGLSVSDDGVALALSYATVHVFGAGLTAHQHKLKGTSATCAVVAPVQGLVIAGLYTGALFAADLAAPKRVATLSLAGGSPRALTPSRDGAALVIATGDNDLVRCSLATLRAAVDAAEKPAKKGRG